MPFDDLLDDRAGEIPAHFILERKYNGIRSAK